jgi:hypothetical protein
MSLLVRADERNHERGVADDPRRDLTLCLHQYVL